MPLPELNFNTATPQPLNFGDQEIVPLKFGDTETNSIDNSVEGESAFKQYVKDPVSAVLKASPKGVFALSKTVNEALGVGAGLLEQTNKALGIVDEKETGIFGKARDWLQSTAKEQGKVLSGDKKGFGLNLGMSEEIKDKKLIENFNLLLDPEWVITQGTDAATQLIPMIAAAYATGGGSAVPAVVGGLQEAGAYYNELRSGGKVSEDDALTSTLTYGVISGKLNKLGLDAILKKTAVTNKLKKAAVSIAKGGVEAGTEYLEGIASAVTKTITEEGITDPKIISKTWDAVKDAAKDIDVMVGAMMAGGGVSALNTKVRKPEAGQRDEAVLSQIEKAVEDEQITPEDATNLVQLPTLKHLEPKVEEITKPVEEDVTPELADILKSFEGYEEGVFISDDIEQPVTESVTGEDYKKNRDADLSLKERVASSTKNVVGEISQGLDKYLGAISTRLGNINPKIKHKIRKLGYDTDTKTVEDITKIQPLLEKSKAMTKEDSKDWDYARKNSDTNKIQELIKKYNLGAEYSQYRETLNQIREEAIDVGLDVGKIKEYAPRVLKDTKGFLKEARNLSEWDIISRRLKQRAREVGLEVDQLTEDQRANIVSDILAGGFNGLGGVANTKQRVFKKIPAKFNKYYMDSDAALMRYVNSMRKTIEARKFFGKVPDMISDIKRRATIANKKLIELQRNPQANASKINEIKSDLIEYNSLLNKYKNQRDYTENIGAYVNELLIKGEIDPSDEKALTEILAARFNEKGTSGLIQGYKNFSYIDTMGSYTSALTQIGDLAWSAYDSGLIPTLKNAAKSFVGKSKITKEDVGIERIAQEFEDPGTLGKAVSKVFKLVGLEKVDSIGKEALLNSSLESYQKQAKRNPTKLKAKISEIFEGETDLVIKDLQNGEITDNVKLLVYNRLLDFQPVALSEMPEKYLNSGNGRVFYMLKTFTLKQFDVFRREAFQKMKSKDKAERIEGIQNLAKLSFYFVAANASADELKDLLLGRQTSIKDRVVDNLLRLGGVSKFVTWKARTEGVGSAALRQILPPVKFIDSLYKDLVTAGDGKGVETLSSIPIVGKLAYWHMGKGLSRSVRADDRSFSGKKRKLKKITDGLKTTKNKKAYRKKYAKEFRDYSRIKNVAKRVTKINKAINKRKKTKDTPSNRKAIERLEGQRDKIIKGELNHG